ncbi:MAG: hypothetical protein LPK88_02425 [Alphaproteobacteria bacterium]|nr:hypothetical protein [Alphaproteobacteria bacterium]MDX5415164.1 hypothetical protein [Alphaproteobacteria bacterium]MDX5492362.1 hypothetical protein [Alphaproteobacteria bacterium]
MEIGREAGKGAVFTLHLPELPHPPSM